MRHGVKTIKLGRNVGHRRAMLKNLATSVLERGSAEEMRERHVITTIDKAKAIRPMVERLITYGKKGDLGSRRQAARFITKPEVLQELFSTIGPRYADRVGGYTRVLRVDKRRHGDNAQLAIITLVENEIVKRPKKKKSPKKAAAKKVDITQAEVKAPEASVEESKVTESSPAAGSTTASAGTEKSE